MASEDKSQNDAWLKSQEAYWNAWFQFCQQAAGTGSDNQGTLPWSKGLESWWAGVSGAVPKPSQDFLQHIVEQGKSFIGLGEKFKELFIGINPADSADWQRHLQAKITELQASFAANPSAFDPKGQWTRLLPFFELPVDTWNRTVSSAGLFPGDFLKSLKNDSFNTAADRLKGRLGEFLSIPGVGYTREWQESIQQTAKLVLEYDNALNAYNQAHAHLSIDTLELLNEKTKAKLDAGEKITSLRELYDLWVDCGEEAYSKFAFSAEYGEVYGRLINALMHLKKHNQHTMDEVAGSLNLPTAQGLTTIQFRQQELRRELARLRAKLDELQDERSNAEPGNTGDEITTLKMQLSALNTKVKELENIATQSDVPKKAKGDITVTDPAETKRSRTAAPRTIKSNRSGG